MATIRLWRRAGAVAVGAAAALALGACEESNPSAEAIDEASLKLEMLAIAGSTGTESDGSLREGYQSVLATLRPAEQAGQSARAAAAGLMGAQAQLGLASLALEDALEAETACSRKQTEVWNLQNNWMRLKSLEASLLAFDPADEVARLEEERTARASEISAAQERLSQVQGELDEMRSRISSLEQQARSKWQEETQVRQDAVDMDEVDRAPLIERANEIKREGDALDRQASEAKAELAAREPELRDVEAQIQRGTIQSEQLTQNIEALRRQHTERQQLATETAEEAAKVADQISRAADELEALRQKTPAAWQEVLDACDAARAKASAAGRERASRDAAQVQTGAAEQMRADALALQASGVEAYASTLELLGNTPKLPGAEEYAEAASGVRQQAAELRQMARTAYRDAADALEGVQSQDERVSETLSNLVGRLRDKAGTAAAPVDDMGGQAPAEMEPAEDASEPEMSPEAG